MLSIAWATRDCAWRRRRGENNDGSIEVRFLYSKKRRPGPHLYTIVCKLQYRTDFLQVFPGIVRAECEGAWDETGEVKASKNSL